MSTQYYNKANFSSPMGDYYGYKVNDANSYGRFEVTRPVEELNNNLYMTNNVSKMTVPKTMSAPHVSSYNFSVAKIVRKPSTNVLETPQAQASIMTSIVYENASTSTNSHEEFSAIASNAGTYNSYGNLDVNRMISTISSMTGVSYPNTHTGCSSATEATETDKKSKTRKKKKTAKKETAASILPPYVKPQEPNAKLPVSNVSVEEQTKLDEKHPNWTVGSRFHAKGQCKPCGLFHSNSCVNGAMCFYCHLCNDCDVYKSKPLRKKLKQVAAAQAEEAANKQNQI